MVRFVKRFRLREFRLLGSSQTNKTASPLFLYRPPSFVSDALAIWDKGAYFRHDAKFVDTFETSAELEEEKS